MRVVKQKELFPIKNYDNCFLQPKTVKRHGNLLPNQIRCIMVGPSNCGKTNVLIGMIINPNGLFFENLYIYSKTHNQPKYQYLKQILNNIAGYFEFKNTEEIIPCSQAKPNSIFIFDDVVCSSQSNIREYFAFGRHGQVDCFYLSQTYSSVPKQVIRDNANLLVVFRQDETNLKHIYGDHVNTDMNYQEFVAICRECWKNRYGFLIIDKESDINKGRYRKGFDQFIYI